MLPAILGVCFFGIIYGVAAATLTKQYIEKKDAYKKINTRKNKK